MADEKKDSATPLTDIFSSSAAESPSPSPAKETDKVEDTPVKADDKSEKPSLETDGDKDKAAAPSEKSEEKTDDLPEGDEKKAAEEAAAKKVAADKAAADEKAKTEGAKPSELEVLTKRFEDTAKWGRELSNQNGQLRELAQKQAEQITILQKKIEGTWTDEDEAAQHSESKPEAVADRALRAGKIIADHAAAINAHGKEKVDAGLAAYHALFDGNEMIQQVVGQSDTPVHTALHMVERHIFEKEHGTTPQQWTKSIREKTEKELRASIRKEILEEIRQGKKEKADAPVTISDAKGDKGEAGSLHEEAPTPLSSIF